MRTAKLMPFRATATKAMSLKSMYKVFDRSAQTQTRFHLPPNAKSSLPAEANELGLEADGKLRFRPRYEYLPPTSV